jgi:RNA polymerase sigma-70 factor (ECF subfamily)
MRSVLHKPGTPARGDDDSERELLARIARSDRAAMQKLYFVYHRRLHRFLARTLPPDQVDEVINDTMFVVWRHAGDFRGDSRLSTWLLGIAYRLALKRLKRNGGRPSASLDQLEAVEAGLADDSGASQREQREWIDRALRTLPAAQRLTIELAYFMGHSCDEIAVMTSTPVNTVKTRLFHARARLRALLPQLAESLHGADDRTSP